MSLSLVWKVFLACYFSQALDVFCSGSVWWPLYVFTQFCMHLLCETQNYHDWSNLQNKHSDWLKLQSFTRQRVEFRLFRLPDYRFLFVLTTTGDVVSVSQFSTVFLFTLPFQVNVTVDYIRAATGPAEGTPAFAERTCATVTIGGM